MRSTCCSLVLAAACVLFAVPSQAEARQPYRAYFVPRPVYTPYRPYYPGVYAYPRVAPPVSYWGAPYDSSYRYAPGWYGAYRYSPGYYSYWAPPYGTSYSYSYPGFYYSFWFR